MPRRFPICFVNSTSAVRFYERSLRISPMPGAWKAQIERTSLPQRPGAHGVRRREETYRKRHRQEKAATSAKLARDLMTEARLSGPGMDHADHVKIAEVFRPGNDQVPML